MAGLRQGNNRPVPSTGVLGYCLPPLAGLTATVLVGSAKPTQLPLLTGLMHLGKRPMSSKGPEPGRQRSDPLLTFSPEQRRPGLMDWLRAWRDVIRDPHKSIPDPPLPPEGVPLPEDLHLCCPECGYNLTGLREWRCPECGQRFSPRRAHTLGMLRQPEYLLRYRFDPGAIQSVFWAVLFFLAGIGLVLAGGPVAMQHGTVMLASFLGVWILPNLVMACTQGGWPWAHFLLFLSVLWLIATSVLLAAVTWM